MKEISNFIVHFHPYGQGSFDPTYLVNMSSSGLTPEAVLGFAPTQLGASTYYYNPALWVMEKGVTSATSATTFGPDNTVTRARR